MRLGDFRALFNFSGLVPCVVACFCLPFQVYIGAFWHILSLRRVSSIIRGKHMVQISTRRESNWH